MAKYKAAPHYVISGGIEFTAFGTYETEDAKEIVLLDSLAPLWITRVDDGNKPEEPAQVEEGTAEDKAAKAPAPTKRKANATSSAK
ncbi:hypothetical protein [Paenibacillus xylanexedens]|uniref:hypothetical protein n=1 Tax=Paenibacillus xylanexedens TaxID=528191 RepID=UPI00119EBDFC|nr:hypothetical protein [Paenibacillus xylanexedens]